MVHAFFKVASQFLIAIALLLFVHAPDPAVAQIQALPKPAKKGKSKKRKRRRDSGQSAVVIVDGSAVYQAQNFDAPVVEYLDRGKKVKISKKVYPGIGGLGTFYKIRIKKGVYGYITDVDIEISGKTGVQATRDQMKNGNEIENDPLKLQDDMNNDTGVPNTGDTIYLTRFFGLSYSSINYTEEIAGQKESSNEGFIGFKMSGPGKWMGGMPLDIELQVLMSPPSFYNDFTTANSGYLLMSHAFAMFPLVDTANQVVYYEFGPTLKYTSFKVDLAGAAGAALGTLDSQEVTLGVGVGLGWALRLGSRWALRLEGVYHYEAESYFGLGGAIQMRY